MLLNHDARPSRRRHGYATALAIVALAGCSGGTGASCGSSCGGAFVTKNPDGTPIKFVGTKLTNVAHSGICGSTEPIQGRIYYNDEPPNNPLVTPDTKIDLDIKFTPSPDGRMELNFTDASLSSIVTRLSSAFINVDGFSNDSACN